MQSRIHISIKEVVVFHHETEQSELNYVLSALLVLTWILLKRHCIKTSSAYHATPIQ